MLIPPQELQLSHQIPISKMTVSSSLGTPPPFIYFLPAILSFSQIISLGSISVFFLSAKSFSTLDYYVLLW